MGRVRVLGGWMAARHSLIQDVENMLLDFCHNRPAAFLVSFALNFLCHGAAVLEVWLILRLIGVPVGFFAALAMEALTKLVNVLGIFNPGNVGTYEGGNMLIARMFGMTGAIGLTLGLARRMRGLFWGAVGAICLVGLTGAKRGSSGNRKEAQASGKVGIANRAHAVIVLAHSYTDGDFACRSPQVGALPVLLRAIVGAQKAAASRIVVVTDALRGPTLKRQLKRTGRLPDFVEWLQLSPGEAPFPALMAHVVPGPEERLVLIAGDRTYNPSLHRLAAEWNGDADGMALATRDDLVGIYVLTRETAIDFAVHGPEYADSLEDLDAWLASSGRVERISVEEDKWQRVATNEERLAAELKLDRWLIKPTDGFFAQMNRRVSIPISRQLIRFPITPNMVSLFTLGVSFLSGLFFARGGYANMLIGALLGLAASILDGCDGEVARLKLQDSAFGCWLETVCDYLYYLFMFAGMTIGLLRTSGTRLYLVLGGLLVFGALISFLVSGLQRRRMTALNRPEQFLANWHAEATRRRTNPLIYLGRRTEFLVRRCFLPYAILVFALFNITHVAFILSVLGANIFWLIALYSYCTFPADRQT